MADYTGAMDACAVPYERLDADEVMRRWPQWRLDARHGRALPGEPAASRRPSWPTTRTARWRDGGAPRSSTRCRSRRCARPAPAWRSMPAVGRSGARKVFLCADAWTNELIRPLGTTLPLTITKEQVTYWASPHLADFAPRALPGLDLDGRAQLLRLPSLRRARPEGRAGRRRSTDHAGDARLRARPGRLRPSGRFHGRHLPGALGPVLVHEDLSLHHAARIATSCSTPCPGSPTSTSRSVPRTASSSRRSSGASSASWPPMARPSSDLEPFRIDRPILLEPDPPTSFMI